jgi:hypothetical protein
VYCDGVIIDYYDGSYEWGRGLTVLAGSELVSLSASGIIAVGVQPLSRHNSELLFPQGSANGIGQHGLSPLLRAHFRIELSCSGLHSHVSKLLTQRSV